MWSYHQIELNNIVKKKIKKCLLVHNLKSTKPYEHVQLFQSSDF